MTRAFLFGAMLLTMAGPAAAQHHGADHRIVSASPDRVFDAALSALEREGYETARSDRARGVIRAVREAPMTTSDAGMIRHFNSDVVRVTITPQGDGTSRVGVETERRYQHNYQGRNRYSRTTRVADPGLREALFASLGR